MFTTPKIAWVSESSSDERLAAVTEGGEREAKQNCYEDHLQYIALRERVHDGGRNDMQHKFRDALGLGLPGVLRHGLRVEIGGIYVEARAGMHEVAHHQSDEQRNRGDNLEIQQRFAADTADLFHVLHAGDAGNHGTKDDQRNDHRDEANETIPERLHGDGFGRAEIAEHNGSTNRDEDLHPEF